MKQRKVGYESNQIKFDRVRPIPERPRHYAPCGPPPRGGTPGQLVSRRLARLPNTQNFYNWRTNKKMRMTLEKF